MSGCSVERGTPFVLFSLHRTANLSNSVYKTSTSAPPFILQVCKRHASLSARVNHHLMKRYSSLDYGLFTRTISPSKQYLFCRSKTTPVVLQRLFASHQAGGKRTGAHSSWDKANRTTVTYMAALAVAVVGLSYAAVPLYRIFCQASGYGGTVTQVDPSEKVENMEPLRERELTVR